MPTISTHYIPTSNLPLQPNSTHFNALLEGPGCRPAARVYTHLACIQRCLAYYDRFNSPTSSNSKPTPLLRSDQLQLQLVTLVPRVGLSARPSSSLSLSRFLLPASSLNFWLSSTHRHACLGPCGASGRISLLSWVSLPGALSGRP